MTPKQAAATTYAFHTDPGHGWLFVPGANLRAVGLGPVHFSRCSYLDGATGADGMYLEEDIDAGIFLARLRHLTGAKPSIQDITHHGDAFIRANRHNGAGWSGMDSVTNWPEVQHGAMPAFRTLSGTFAHADGITHD
jgi:hypothetical protein